MAQKSKTKKRVIIGILAVVGATFLISLLAFWNPLEKWQFKLTNHLYGHNAPSDDIVIIAIDKNSANADGLGLFSDWSREYYVKAIQNLEQKGAKIIAFDLFFINESDGISSNSLSNIILSNPSLEDYFEQTFRYLKSPNPEDVLLAETISQYKNIVLAEKYSFEENNTITNIPLIDVLKDKAETGAVLNISDSDNVVRRIQANLQDISEQKITPLSFKVAEMYLGALPKALPSGLDSNGNMLINFAAPPYNFQLFSFIDAYNDLIPTENIKDKIVLIGVTSTQLQDHFTTPTSPDTPMPGVEVHANAIQTILEQKFLHEQSIASQTISVALLTTLLVTALLLLGVIPGLAVTVITIAAYYLSGQFFFNHGLIINFVYPILAIFAAYLTITLYKSLAETQEKKQLTSAFSKYVNKDLVAQIANNPDMLKLGGEKRTVTVFFSDIENSTSLSEKLAPEALVSILNEYFTVMTGIILKNKGTVNKFEGDAIMAFWGAPVIEPQHAILAARSAIECRVALKALHEKWLKQGNKPLIEFRIGLASGEVIAGNIGSQDRFDYTVMGDIVNLGSRLEGANKEYGTRIMISDLTYAAIRDEFETRHLDHLRVKGKNKPVDVYELLTFKGKLEDRHRQIIDTFHAAMTLYRDGKFTEAEQKFQEVKKLAPLDKTTDIYLSRLATLKQNPPANWDGTWTLETK